jgi:hypothetical protein
MEISQAEFEEAWGPSTSDQRGHRRSTKPPSVVDGLVGGQVGVVGEQALVPDQVTGLGLQGDRDRLPFTSRVDQRQGQEGAV